MAKAPTKTMYDLVVNYAKTKDPEAKVALLSHNGTVARERVSFVGPRGTVIASISPASKRITIHEARLRGRPSKASQTEGSAPVDEKPDRKPKKRKAVAVTVTPEGEPLGPIENTPLAVLSNA